ncbi:PREDICTED: SEC12-like protein 2 isoform X2 [Camelina sativa]|uniref:SEC12-like protein 2 isoform X2 n=1 Tax=Camelina sativa TaxID=90675 RepID=A0ABM0TDV5_CAMSA|nr:PREDICTED: SEC12-like protein 2 isoform X2 [Camelina sativa]
MANQSTETNQPSNMQTYGVPLYAVDWIPEVAVRSKIIMDPENSEENDVDESESSSSSSSRSCIVLSGGGGEGRSGIPNVILICRVDLDTNSLSEQPLGKLVLGTDLPYRMTVHPREGGLICSSPDSCRLFGWDNIMSPREDYQAGEEPEEVIKELKDVGQQLALAFNPEGSVLAAGAEDGTLRVFEWPSMKSLINESQAHSSVKSLTFSENGKFLVSLGGPLCRVWEVNASTAVASLSKEKDEILASCRFSVDSAGNEILYVAANTERGVSIITWDTKSWKRKESKPIKKNTMSAFNVSPDGKLLAIGTLEGDVLILDSTRKQTNQIVKKAHLGLVTALTFSPDSRCLVSVSFDSRARLTVINKQGEKPGTRWWILAILFVFLYVVAYYFLKAKGIIP